MRKLLFKIIIFALITACASSQKHIKKFIFIAGQDIVFDSTDNPNLSIRKYLEYNYSHDIKIATGHRFYDSISPAYGLDKFYIKKFDQAFGDLLDNTFIDSSFRTEYTDNKKGLYYYYIVKTDHNKAGIICFNNPLILPTNLKFLYDRIQDIYLDTTLTKNKFKVDSSVVDLQDSLFLRYPPPPKPPNGISDSIIKFRRIRE